MLSKQTNIVAVLALLMLYEIEKNDEKILHCRAMEKKRLLKNIDDENQPIPSHLHTKWM